MVTNGCNGRPAQDRFQVHVRRMEGGHGRCGTRCPGAAPTVDFPFQPVGSGCRPIMRCISAIWRVQAQGCGGPWGLPGLLCPPSPLKRAVFRSLLPLITAPRDDQSPLENAPDETTRIKATPALIFPLGSPTGFKRLADRCTDLRREHVMAVTRMIEPRTDSCQCSMRASHLRESHPDTTTYAPDHSPP